MKIRFVTPWYPDYAAIHSGVFVEKQVLALRELGHFVTVTVPQIFPAPPGPIPRPVLDAMRALSKRSPSAMFASDGDTTYVPTPVPSRGGFLGRAQAMSQSLALLDDLLTGPVDLTHAHVAMPAGWAVAQIHESTPLVITEHWSGLATIFNDPVAVDAYAEVVRRADAFICVSNHLRHQIADALGEWVLGRIEVVPNIVDLSEIRFVRRDTYPFSRWIYVGGLMAHKGVQALLRAFDQYVKGHDESATLTLVGDGPLRRWIETFAASRGLAGVVTVAGTVEHIRLADFLDQANVMVHLSPAETFGIASLEAIGAGLPVVSLRNSGAVGAWGEIEPQCGALLDLESSAADVANAVAALRRAPDGLDLAAGRAFVEEHFSPHVIAERLAGVYRRVLG